jgi:diacylglycerol kinase (ATP)
VAAGRSRVLDLIRADAADDRADSRLVTNSAVAGFASRIGESMSAAFRRRWRPAAYLIAALRQLGDLRPYDVRLEADGRRIDERILMAIVANSRFAGGKIPFAPTARTDDGWLDVVLIRAQPAHRVAALIPRILRGRHVAHPGVRTLRASEIHLESDPSMWINLDGEIWHAAPSRFRVLPSALRVLAP